MGSGQKLLFRHFVKWKKGFRVLFMFCVEQLDNLFVGVITWTSWLETVLQIRDLLKAILGVLQGKWFTSKPQPCTKQKCLLWLSFKTPVTCQQEDILDHEDVSFLTSLGPGGNSEGPQDSSLFLGLSCPWPLGACSGCPLPTGSYLFLSPLGLVFCHQMLLVLLSQGSVLLHK